MCIFKEMRLFIPFTVAATCVDAWSNSSHEVVAAVAAARLSPAAINFVSEVFKVKDVADLPARLMQESLWADTKASEEFNAESAKWHFYQAPVDGALYADNPCAPDTCIVPALVDQTILAMLNPEPAMAVNATRFLLHLMGDAHQPLHAGRAADAGGNGIKVDLAPTEQKRLETNGKGLHQAWDLTIPAFAALRDQDRLDPLQVQLVGRRPGKRDQYPLFTSNEIAQDIVVRLGLGSEQARSLEAGSLGFDANSVLNRDDLATIFGELVDETHALSLAHAYPSAADLDLAKDEGKNFVLTSDYVRDNAALVTEQLAKAGARLAELLNAIAAARDALAPPAANFGIVV